jgi:hypothetical protein
MKRMLTYAISAVLMSAIAYAADPPATALVGAVTTGLFTGAHGYSCYGNNINALDSLASAYFRPSASGPIILNLGTPIYQRSDGHGQIFYDRYNGTASLHFSTATSGIVHWDFIPTGFNVHESDRYRHFSAYSQTYTAVDHLLTLSFSLDFGGCSLPVKGVFHG